jgi:hypothetical protein
MQSFNSWPIIQLSNGAIVEIVDVGGQHDDDIEFAAIYTANGLEVEDGKLIDEIYRNYSDKLYQEWYENRIEESDFYYNGEDF